ncbi:hypothetical protein GCM10011339_11830 [Echinicola rosea]|uniref:Uncharacterized protein n=1 Tax=Echinicola rosea TaxID=1807691 RepID=A0ABQ1URJ6_9BACT|nr:hypothetical protein GCM10011339_11830 [Echinicola rosea]
MSINYTICEYVFEKQQKYNMFVNRLIKIDCNEENFPKGYSKGRRGIHSGGFVRAQ